MILCPATFENVHPIEKSANMYRVLYLDQKFIGEMLLRIECEDGKACQEVQHQFLHYY
jgi:hypothetical protein